MKREGITSLTLIDMKLSDVSVASALAIIVLEHPGGPYMSTPRGGLIPSLWNLSACCRGQTIACISFCFKSACPPMSVHLTCTKQMNVEMKRINLITFPVLVLYQNEELIRHKLFVALVVSMWYSGRSNNWTALILGAQKTVSRLKLRVNVLKTKKKKLAT